MNIRSDLTTLSQISADQLVFNVPIYQRLYVWGTDQIGTLLEDLVTGFQQKNDFFYLGGALVVERQGESCSFDLIDGQQRFTTLWMMSLAWQEVLSPFLRTKRDLRPRVSFSIRPEVDDFFDDQLNGQELCQLGNPRIVDALASLRAFRDGFGERTDADGHPLNFAAFTDFVFHKVQLVLTRVPAHTDLNKLFEVINNRGVQLQHHEILKARLLKFLSHDATERDRYASLWDACAHMPGYAEQNLRKATGIRVTELFKNGESRTGIESLSRGKKVLAALHLQRLEEESAEPKGIEDILTLEIVPEFNNFPDTSSDTYESREVRSIVTFPMLLQHTLRIWLADRRLPDLPRILDKELLTLFSNHFLCPTLSEDDVRSFIRLLWEVRYAFDKHVIKWVNVGEEEQHLICSLYLSSSRSSITLQRRRPESNEPFALLQSMLYHSQQITTHYWLTPLLSFLLKEPGAFPERRLDYLKHLDNHLLSSTDAQPLVERSRNFLRDPWHRSELIDITKILSKPDGLRFPHYWFYKLEWILWHTNALKLSPKELATFRMTAKNSIEHISAQRVQAVDRDAVSPETLNTFGNLALVSRSLNSEYGNKPYNEKREHFENHNRERIDSLKMKAIYQSSNWGSFQALKHQREMIHLLDHYISLSNSGADHL